MKKKSIVLLLFTMLMSMNVMAQTAKKAKSAPAKQVKAQTQKKKVAAKLSLPVASATVDSVAGVADSIKNFEDEGAVLKVKESIANESPEDSTIKVFDIVEVMPEFAPCSYEITVYNKRGNAIGKKMRNCPGGAAGLLQFISDNIYYPTIAEENGIQGRVVCTFVIERDGSVSDVQVARSIDPSLDKEAVRVLSKMPNWKPGRHKGENVRVKYTVPVTFKLQ